MTVKRCAVARSRYRPGQDAGKGRRNWKKLARESGPLNREQGAHATELIGLTRPVNDG